MVVVARSMSSKFGGRVCETSAVTLRQVTSPPSSGASVHSQYSPEKPSSQTQENESTPSEQRPPLKHLDKGCIERKLKGSKFPVNRSLKNLPLSFRIFDVEFSRDVKSLISKVK